MKTKQECLAIRATVTAVRATLVAVAAMSAAQADEREDILRSLTQPTNAVELGAGYVSQDSAKFGEYNGLFNKGWYGIFNFDVRGGGSYDSNDPTRWRITGTDLGLETRDATAEYGQQGKFRINLGFDQLPRERSDNYQTPYNGAGSNNLTLPGNWVPPKVPQVNPNNVNFRSFDPVAGTGPTYNSSGVLTQPTQAQLDQLSNIRAADVPAYHNVDLSTKRTTYDAGFSYNFSPQWDIRASYRHMHKDGVKWMGAVSSQVSEFSAIIPDLIDQDTDQVNASLNYNGEKGFAQLAYYGSFFRNGVQSMTFQDVNDPTKSATLGSAPDNTFNQFSLTGGYHFSPTVKLVVNGSYARGTQDEAFLGPATAANGQLAFGLPRTSLDGLVVWTAFNAKLTARPVKALSLAANYKYDDRDNRSPVDLYLFQDANESKSSTPSPFSGLYGLPTGIGSNTNIYNNRAYSKKLNQVNLQADYAVAKGQWLEAAYDWQKIDRNCNGAWIDCADAAKTTENTLRAEWRASVIEDLNWRVDYAYSQRRGDYNENAFLALVPMANFIPAGGATQSVYSYLLQAGLTGFGPLAGLPSTPLTGDAAIFSPNNNIVPQALYGSRNNINELVGMRRYFVANRNRDKLRAAIDWQANEKLSLQGALDFNKDDYPDSVYGLQDAKYWAASVEGSYAVTEDLVANAFYTYEDQRFTSAGDAYGANSTTAFVGQAGNTLVSGGCFATVKDRSANAKIDPCLNWSKDGVDKNQTLGFSFKQRNLMSGRLELIGNLLFTWARTDLSVNGGSYVNNPLALAPPAPPLAPGVPAVFFIPASNFPAVTNRVISVGLTGTYAIDKASGLRLAYLYQRMRSSDYAYDGMQFGTGTNYLPTLEHPFEYDVNVFGVSYLYRWQ